MDERTPALFYFWAHGGSEDYNPMDELNTPTFHRLVERTGVVFIEFISSDFDGTRQLESDFNECVRTGKMPLKLRRAYDYQLVVQGRATAEFFIADLLKKSQKRIVLEKTLEAPFNYMRKSAEADKVFFESSLEKALEARKRFLEIGEDYQRRRERDVAEQIDAFPESVVVLFGAGHPELERMVAVTRPTEVHFPYSDYPLIFETQLQMKYRETGELDRELFLRSMAEGMARKGIGTKFGKSISSRENDLLAHHYAAALTPDKIIGLKDYSVSCRRMLVGISSGDVFSSYVHQERITSPEEILAGLRA